MSMDPEEHDFEAEEELKITLAEMAYERLKEERYI